MQQGKYHKSSTRDELVDYLGQRIVAIQQEIIHMQALLRDVVKREHARRRDRLKGFLGRQISEAKEERLERRLGRKVGRDYKLLNKSLKHLSIAVKKQQKIEPLFAEFKSHLDDELIFDSKQLFLITIDMGFDLKEAIQGHKELVHLVEVKERRVRKAA